MRVEHGLPRDAPAVHSDVECSHRRIGIDNPDPDLLDQPMDGSHLAVMQVEVVDHMPTRNHEAVQRRHRMPVLNRDCERVRRDDALLVQFAENTPLLPQGVAFTDSSEIRGITSTLVGVAQPAESLQVVGIVGAPVFAWNDVIDIQRPLVPLLTTQAECSS